MEPSKHRVALVFGGRRGEHSISCLSAGSILTAIDRSKFEVVPVGITRAGTWRIMPDDPEGLRIIDGSLPEVTEPTSPADRLILSPDPNIGGLLVGDGAVIGIDVVFPVLHGAYGEDGTIQGLCELADLPYVGPGVASSAICMDKILTKNVLAAVGLPIGPYVGVTDQTWTSERESVIEAAAALGLPLFVKPARGGSSLGISKVEELSALEPAIEEARRYDHRVIVERGLVGARELECGVLAGSVGGPAEVSVCAEIEVTGPHDFYDFQAKYLDGSARITVPADITADQHSRVVAIAQRAFAALGCEGMARIDLFLLEDGTVLINEPNTIPGFTSTSMFPAVWAASGVDYQQLIERLLTDAIAQGASALS